MSTENTEIKDELSMEATSVEETQVEEMVAEPSTETEKSGEANFGMVEEPKIKEYIGDDYANFVMSCSCGNKIIQNEHVQGGVRFELPATNAHRMDVKCGKCDAHIVFHFEDGEAPAETQLENIVHDELESKEGVNEVQEDSKRGE